MSSVKCSNEMRYSFDDFKLMPHMQKCGYDIRIQNFTILDLPRSSYKQDREYTPGKSEEACLWTAQELIEGKRIEPYKLYKTAFSIAVMGCFALGIFSYSCEAEIASIQERVESFGRLLANTTRTFMVDEDEKEASNIDYNKKTSINIYYSALCYIFNKNC